jgi:glucose/arabinose dehydrogenase
VMEYFDGSGDASARLSYSLLPTTLPANAWKGEYFATSNLGASGVLPALVRADPTIDFDWGAQGPADNFSTNNFSVRWTHDLVVSAGTYRFATFTDDGVRLKIDGVSVIDHFSPQSVTYYEYDTPLTAGSHTIVMEYFEGYGDALAKLSWARKASPEEGIVRINAGGSGYADSFNNFWSPDMYVTNTTAVTATSSEEAQPIWNTTDDPLYINEHSTVFRYDIPLSNGNYVVRLHFAELFFNAPGVRRFGVAVQGTPVLSNFDIYAQAGKASLITKSFPANVTNGMLTVVFSKVFDNAVVQALDVYPASSGVDLTAPVFAAIPEPENTTYTTPPAVTLAINDDVKLNDGYVRIDDQDPQPLFTDLNGAVFNGQFTMAVDTFNALPLGAHTLSFGANDRYGNAWTKVWRFRKLNSGSGAMPIAFNRRTLLTPSTPGAANFKHPTTLQFGPDGKLYAGQQDFFGKGGYIHVLTLDDNRNVTNVQRIDSIFNTPNINPDGTPAPTVKGRHLIGLDFDPRSSPEKPILWAVHSDPRFCFNQSPATCKVNTDSGILTRLIGPNFDDPASRTDFVTGLPRSRENHAPNAVHFGPDGWLYMTIGSNTNYGAVSTAFSGLAETYLTAALLRFNVNGAPASAFPLDVRDVNSATGLKPGIFELYATGYRNAYDFLWHSNGKLYANVNAGNFTAGNTPGPPDGCPDGHSFDPGTRNDYLALVESGDYGGNPNPARGECILDDGTMYPSPLTPLPDYHRPLLYYSNGTSSDGMAEYTAPTFGGQMLGNIISTTYAGSQSVRRAVLAEDGASVLFEEDLGIFSQPLDVAVGPDGSIYVGEYGANDIQIMEPDPPLEGTWETLTPLPAPTQEVGTVACDGKVYVLGGLIAPAVDTGAVWVYDPAGQSWTAAAPYTTDPAKYVDHPGAACLDGKVYLIGGLLKAGVAVKHVYEYSPAANTWTPKADLPHPRGAAGVAVLDGTIYVAGGLGYPDKNDLFAYNAVTNTWETKAPMPTARDHFIMEAIGGKLYAIGGRTNVTLDPMTAVNEVYDPATNTWATRKPMPIPRAAMASGILHGHIQLWGGETTPGNPNATVAGVFKQGQDYDPKTDSWIAIADELTPRHGTDGATIDNKTYVPGGAVHQGDAATDVNDVFAFVSADDIPSCIPAASDPNTTDSDSDGYTNQDEADNGTNPCSSASTPSDNDGDQVSDRHDTDDDNDGVADASDQYQFDAMNGTATTLPWVQNWNPGDAPAGKFGNSGFTGYQVTTSGAGFIADKVHVGGAGGFLSLNATTGTNQGTVNTQDNALQIGFDARQTVKISTRLADPLSGQVVEPGKSGGIFFGLDQDNYVKLALTTDTGTGLQHSRAVAIASVGRPGLIFAIETNGDYAANPGITPVSLEITTTTTLDLFLVLDPTTKRVIAQYRINSDDDAAIVTLGEIDVTAYPGLANFFQLGTAAGILSTNATGSSFGLAYDYFRIDPSSAPATLPRRVYLPLVSR